MSLKKFIPEFHPKQKGLSKVLGSLEAEVMEKIWLKQTASVKDVHQELLTLRPIAYTTVMTIMGRLADKRLLKKVKEGNAFIYTPVVSKEEFSKNIVSEVIDSLLEDFPDAAFSHFVKKIGQEDENKINELEQLLKEKMRKEE